MAAHAAPRPRHARTLPLLLTALATALACQHRHPTFLWDSARLLRDVAPGPAQPCPHPQPAFRFPEHLLRTQHPQQAAAAALRILQHLFATLNSPSIPEQWDNPAWRQLLNGLHHHIHRLEQCPPPSPALLPTPGPRDPLLAINRYFANIHDFLRAHNHSACAWDHVRLQAHACLRHVDVLMRHTRSWDAPALHQTPADQVSTAGQPRPPQTERRQPTPGLGWLRTAHTSSGQAPAPTGRRG